MKNKFILGHHFVVGFLGVNTMFQLRNLTLSYESSIGDIDLITPATDILCNGYRSKYINIYQSYHPYLTTGYMFILGDKVSFNVFILGLHLSVYINFPWKKRKKGKKK